MKWRHNGCVVQLQTVSQSLCSGRGPDHENTIILLVTDSSRPNA